VIPRPESAPVTLALHLSSPVRFAVLLPVDLLEQVCSPWLCPDAPHEEIKRRFRAAGKITLLSAQMTWVIGNIPSCAPIETYSNAIVTAAPSPGSSSTVAAETFADSAPQTVENWIHAQHNDPTFAAFVASIPDSAVRDGLHVHAPDDRPARILVPDSLRQPLMRLTHRNMCHLGAAKVSSALRKMYFWSSLTSDCAKTLADCPDCELEKARQNTAHGMFAARPFDAPRSRFAMDFQGQGLATTGESEALGIIDTTSRYNRYVTVLCLPDREATTFIPAFLDSVVFVHGPPAVLHSDAAPEFLSEAMSLLAAAIETSTTTTLGHNARGKSAIEVFWRYWNRCMRSCPTTITAAGHLLLPGSPSPIMPPLTNT
jgi:hypothetical protein